MAMIDSREAAKAVIVTRDYAIKTAIAETLKAVQAQGIDATTEGMRLTEGRILRAEPSPSMLGKVGTDLAAFQATALEAEKAAKDRHAASMPDGTIIVR